MSELELKRQLFEAKQEIQRWQLRCKKLTAEKDLQLRSIEMSMVLLEEGIKNERARIVKILTRQSHQLKQQKNKIDTLSSANQKLVAAMMVLRYKKPVKYPSVKNRDEKRNDSASPKHSRTLDKKERSKAPRTYPIEINGSDLIACRAKSYADQHVERSISERSPRESSSSGQREKKNKAHRSHSLPQGTRTIML